MKIPFYQKIIPRSIRLHYLKKRILLFLEKTNNTTEQYEILKWLKINDLNVFPYDFIKKYNPENIEIFKDEKHNLFYTFWEGKKLFYKNGNQKHKAQVYFNSLLLEQDEASPHKYLHDDFQVSENDVVLDIGAAEGNFSLTIIEKVKFIYLLLSNG